KNVDGKEALAIILSKRSGVDITIQGSWKGAETRTSFDHRLLRFSQLHLTDELPDGAAYELRDLYLRLNCDKREPQYNTLQEAMRDEALRILGRKQIVGNGILEELSDDLRNKISVED